MRVGWVGLGKLGLPCALVMAQHHKVTGYDVSELPWKILYGQEPPPAEEGIGALLDDPRVRIDQASSIAEVVDASDVVFVAVQTPHAPAYGGEAPAPEQRSDFDYSALAQAVRSISAAAGAKVITVAVVSTVLPGTCSRLLAPVLGPAVRFAYTPAFIAMGTTINDYRNPEFQVVGSDGPSASYVGKAMARVFSPVHGGRDRTFLCRVEDGELIKVAYNTFISMKVTWANAMMELCHKTGADCDVLVDALSLATDRVVSPAYLRGGMGDGGACHPRDLIAMSWLAQRLDLSYDLMGELVKAREAQSAWLASLVQHHAAVSGLPVRVLGKAYKAGSPLTAGSPALLLAQHLGGLPGPEQHDPYAEPLPGFLEPALFVIATAHPEFFSMDYPEGSVIIDPWGQMPDHPGLTVIRVGRKQ